MPISGESKASHRDAIVDPAPLGGPKLSQHNRLEHASQPALNEAEREELRALVSQAVEAIPPNWPLRTFAYRNPLIGFEHLPFEEAISEAKKVI